jgi:uncharacterized integral membrane protein
LADHDPTKTHRSQDRSWKLWAGLVALLVLVIFVVQNSQEVTVDFLFTTTTTPLIFALVFAGALGALVGWLLPRVRRGGRRHEE